MWTGPAGRATARAAADDPARRLGAGLAGATFLAWLGGWLAIFAVAYLRLRCRAIVILPLLLKHLSETEYRDLAMLGRDSFVAATLNSLGAALLFVLQWMLTIPLWLIPGLSLVVPLLLMAWLNRRTFAYDALSAHAGEEEWQVLSARHKGPFLLLGLCMALLAHVPLLGLLVFNTWQRWHSSTTVWRACAVCGKL